MYMPVVLGLTTLAGLICLIQIGGHMENVDQDPVETECGRVTGIVVGNVTAFKGIRYATATRWSVAKSLPEAGQCWAPALMKAHKSGPNCLDIFGEGKSADECLWLTVWASPNSTRKATQPVMVFFHGGDLTLGAANTDFSLLASHGSGAVVVDVNYRLNLDGFLSVDAMREESTTNSSGMYGIRDMIESLRWTQRNILAFGADPNRVMIFGQSSGGTAVLILAASPLARGLFSSALSLSGSVNVSMAAERQRQQHQHIAEKAGCGSGSATDIMGCLRSLRLGFLGKLWLAEPKGKDHGPGTEESPSWLMDNIFDVPRHSDGLRAPGLAVVDGDVLRAPLPEALKGQRTPLIISSMAQETADGLTKVGKLSPDELEAKLADIFSYVNASFGNQVASMYAADIQESRQLAWNNIGTDVGTPPRGLPDPGS
jgi:carboxylesterase type B